ncbi:hypothetical protein F2Q68_00028486 [Brassica cretica]|uniref:Helicase ATP-binding domain-containing protein n=1 Tax=Brassica cretica TaxID=69181 RepID=A0A8S9ID66_BRACR|nr:hypothetical protein F2Q68_00028486 [Brassica cretica]
MLFDLDMRYSLPMYISTLYLSASRFPSSDHSPTPPPKENLELSLLYATLTVTQIRFSGGQDWKATLRVPPPDTRYQTAMILVPMRELALQTSQVCKELSKYLNIQVMVTTGVCVLKDCTMLVMDEADKLLSAEFQAFVCRVPGRLSS